MKPFFIAILLALCNVGLAQEITKAQSDCENAIIFMDSVQGNLTIPKGYGNKLEIKGHDIKNPYFFTKEHNTLWIKLVFTKAAKFEFFIRPDLPNEDYDFSIFKVNGPNFCDSIATNKVLPVRSNICRRKPTERSVTGLKEGFDNYYAAAGESPSFSAPLIVEAGDEYYLVLDGPYGSIGGFKFETKYEEIKKVVEASEPIITEKVVVTPKLHIGAIDKLGNKIANPGIQVRGNRSEDSIYRDSIGDWVVDKARRLTRYNITLTCKGYKQQEFNYFHKTDGDSTLTFTLEKLTIGSKLKFEHINFMGNQASILPSSEEDLKKLTLFLKENPHIDVEIGGHVNGKGRNRRKYKKLSKERAKAIFDYLVKKNISESQLTYAGYGNSKMVYQKAHTEKESKANRRVEAIVTNIE